jgi:hypothetical protein
MTAKEAKALLGRLIGHKCKKCGSIPVYPGNNVDNGELTVNYVKRTCGEGIWGGTEFVSQGDLEHGNEAEGT